MPKNLPQKLPLGILASGTGSNLQAIIDACEAEDITAQVALVISDRPAAQALKRAQRHHIPAFGIDPRAFASQEAFESEIVALLRQHHVELLCLAGYMRLVGTTLLAAFPQRILNVHPALLPAFPGLHAPQQALDYGAKISGCTIHIVDEQTDHGPIICQTAVAIDERETIETLTRKIQREEHRLYPHAISLFAEDRIRIEGRRVVVKRKPAGGGL